MVKAQEDPDLEAKVLLHLLVEVHHPHWMNLID